MWQSDDIYNNNFSGKAGQDACRQDSGGPLITKLRGQRYAQIGIVHVGSDCQVKHEKKWQVKVSFFALKLLLILARLLYKDHWYFQMDPKKYQRRTIEQMSVQMYL